MRIIRVHGIRLLFLHNILIIYQLTCKKMIRYFYYFNYPADTGYFAHIVRLFRIRMCVRTCIITYIHYQKRLYRHWNINKHRKHM